MFFISFCIKLYVDGDWDALVPTFTVNYDSRVQGPRPRVCRVHLRNTRDNRRRLVGPLEKGSLEIERERQDHVTKYFNRVDLSVMVAPVVKPLSVGAGWAIVAVFIESVLVSSIPTVVVVLTSVGPFVPILAGAWSRRRSVMSEDTTEVYLPLLGEVAKVQAALASGEKWKSSFPFFQRDKLDPIRASGRYLIVKDEIPTVERLIESMDAMSNLQGDGIRAAKRIIKDTIQELLRVDGDEVSFTGRNRDGGIPSFGTQDAPILLINETNPLAYYASQGVEIGIMSVSKGNTGTKSQLEFPRDLEKYHLFWKNLERRADLDRQIKSMRTVLGNLPTLASNAESELIDKINRSRSIFYS